MHGSNGMSGLPEAWLRFKAHMWLKPMCFIAYLFAFMAVYFLLLRHPLFPVTLMPRTALDRVIGFAPWSLGLYVSLWFYIAAVPSMMWDWREIRPYLAQVTLLSALGFAIFLLWPTAVPDPALDAADHPSVAFLKSVDATGNACPSLHVAFAVLTAIWLIHLLRHLGAPLWLNGLNLLWCCGILYSTLATRQHLALDLYAGTALGAAVALLGPRPRFLSPNL